MPRLIPPGGVDSVQVTLLLSSFPDRCDVEQTIQLHARGYDAPLSVAVKAAAVPPLPVARELHSFRTPETIHLELNDLARRAGLHIVDAESPHSRVAANVVDDHTVRVTIDNMDAGTNLDTYVDVRFRDGPLPRQRVFLTGRVEGAQPFPHPDGVVAR